jgi:hypothetical protein
MSEHEPVTGAKTDASSEKAKLENAKLRLETQKLNEDLGWVGRFSTRIWPMVATSLTIILSVIAVVVSVLTQRNQADLQRKLAEETLAFNQSVHHDDSLRAAITLATDKSGDSDRRIAGIWQLNTAWSHPDDYEMVASTLTAELGLPDENRSARCAAAEVLGQAMKRAAMAHLPETDRDRLGKLLFGDPSGALGLVTIQNILASQSGTTNIQDAKKPCQTALDATREAIRKNWTDLRNRNFAGTDLRGIQLYQADLSGANFYGTKIQNANMRCTNVHDVSLGDADGKESADFLYSNMPGDNDPAIKALMPGDNDPAIKALAIKALADKGFIFQLDDATWRQWRDKGMRVDAQGKPVMSHQEGTPLQCLYSDVPHWQAIVKEVVKR